MKSVPDTNSPAVVATIFESSTAKAQKDGRHTSPTRSPLLALSSASTIPSLSDNNKAPCLSHKGPFSPQQQLQPRTADYFQTRGERRPTQARPAHPKIEKNLLPIRPPNYHISNNITSEFDDSRQQQQRQCNGAFKFFDSIYAVKADLIYSHGGHGSEGRVQPHLIEHRRARRCHSHLFRSSSSTGSGASMTDASIHDVTDSISEEPSTPLSPGGDLHLDINIHLDHDPVLLSSRPQSIVSLEEEASMQEEVNEGFQDLGIMACSASCFLDSIQSMNKKTNEKEVDVKAILDHGERRVDGHVDIKASCLSDSTVSKKASLWRIQSQSLFMSTGRRGETEGEQREQGQGSVPVKIKKGLLHSLRFLLCRHTSQTKTQRVGGRRLFVSTPASSKKMKTECFYTLDPCHPLSDYNEMELAHPHNPFFHIQKGVPFQQIVPEKPSRFPYPRRMKYTSSRVQSYRPAVQPTATTASITLTSPLSSMTSPLSSMTSSSSSSSSPSSMDRHLRQQKSLTYEEEEEDEEAQRRELIHRLFLKRLRKRNGSDQVRRLPNIVLTDPTFRRETEPVVVARFRRIYTRSKQIPAKTTLAKEDQLRPMVADGHTSNELISRRSTQSSMTGGKILGGLKNGRPKTSFAFQFERYQQLCDDRTTTPRRVQVSSVAAMKPVVASEATGDKCGTMYPPALLRLEALEQKIPESAPPPGIEPSRYNLPAIVVSRCPSLHLASSSGSSSPSPYAAQVSYPQKELALHLKKISQRIEESGANLGGTSSQQDLSPSRCVSLNHRTVASIVSVASSMNGSVYSALSAQWQRPSFYEKSKSRRYPQSLQSHIKVKNTVLEQQQVDVISVMVLDVNDTTALCAAGVDPEKPHPHPEAFYDRQFTHFQTHGSFLEDVPTGTVAEPQKTDVAPPIILVEPSFHLESLSNDQRLSNDRRLMTSLSSPLRRAVMAMRGSCRRFQRSVHGLITKTKERCEKLSLTGKQRKETKEECEKVKEIHEILFASTSLCGRKVMGNKEDIEEEGAWVLKIPADHGSIGRFECSWLDAMVA